MLIFSNGTAYFATKSSAIYIDEQGNPVKSTQLYDVECECMINTLSDDKRGRYEDGRYRNCSYSVLIDMDGVGKNFNPQSVKLEHENKGNLGEFQVQRIEYYNLTSSIEIWV